MSRPILPACCARAARRACPWPRAHIGAAQLDQVEGVEERVPRAATGQGRAQPGRSPSPRARRTLPPHRRTWPAAPATHVCVDDERHAVGPIAAVAGEHAHAVAVTPAYEPETVVFDFIGPTAVP